MDTINIEATVESNPISKYVISHNHDPLIFAPFINEKVVLKFEDDTIDELVKQIVIASRSYYSKSTSTNRLETSPGRLRSSLDIWRHCIFYNPKVTIFDVMANLNKNIKIYYTHYCTTVHRRVFRYISDSYWGRAGDFATNSRDEYGLYFRQWKDINSVSRLPIKFVYYKIKDKETGNYLTGPLGREIRNNLHKISNGTFKFWAYTPVQWIESVETVYGGEWRSYSYVSKFVESLERLFPNKFIMEEKTVEF